MGNRTDSYPGIGYPGGCPSHYPGYPGKPVGGRVGSAEDVKIRTWVTLYYQDIGYSLRRQPPGNRLRADAGFRRRSARSRRAQGRSTMRANWFRPVVPARLPSCLEPRSGIHVGHGGVYIHPGVRAVDRSCTGRHTVSRRPAAVSNNGRLPRASSSSTPHADGARCSLRASVPTASLLPQASPTAAPRPLPLCPGAYAHGCRSVPDVPARSGQA